MIDPHVHLRDFAQKDKETILHGLSVAKSAGMQAVFDMPNTNPPLTTEDALLSRLSLAKVAMDKVKGISYHLYLGLTTDDEQIKNAVKLYKKYFPAVVGLKLFAGQSTGNMGIVCKEEQQKVFRALSLYSYTGVIAIHAEKESEMKKELFVPGNTYTHSLARPEKAEIESIKDILAISNKEGFLGHLHFCHISTKGGIDLLKKAIGEGRKVSFGVTPHHALFNCEDAKNEDRYLKMNPPLRSEESRMAVFNSLLDGTAFNVESDHAPHLLSDKEKGASGIPGFKGMLLLYKRLKESGVNEERLKELFGGNVLKLFSLSEEEIIIPDNIDTRLEFLSFAYPFDPFY